MRLLQFLIYAVVGYIIWKLIRLAMALRNPGKGHKDPPVEFPPDSSYRNIEDADFEDITRDPDKSS
jgi:hypothetical protein